jgi:tartrate-resistant acid phosphatase type 5
MIDTVLLSVGEDGVLDGAEALARSEAHWAWLRAELAGSDADFLIVGGHYPVWSAGEHGSTPHLVDRLRPLLLAHNVSAYFAGHDHCAQAFVDGGVHHHGVGGAHLLNYGSEHLRELPDGILAMYLASTVWPANVFKGTFATVAIGARAMRVTHYDSDGNALITLEQLPRERSRRAERPAAAAQPQPETRRSMSLVTPTIAINGFNERDRTR